jgi:uncharacterized membrane protein
MDNYESRIQQIVERTRSAQGSLWSALLTAHTVVLSVAVALLVTVTPSEAWQLRWAGFIATVCVVVLMLNFALTKSHYELIGQRLTDPSAEISESERNADLRKAAFRRRLAAIGDAVAISGLSVEVVLLGWVLAAS